MSDTAGADAPDVRKTGDEGSEVFLCAECNLVFYSRVDCTQHMNRIHDLKEFNFSEIELVEESKKAVVQRRKVNPPRKYCAPGGGGTVIPKSFQVTKDSHLHRCPLCAFKFESLEVLEFHQECHDQEPATTGSRNRRGFICRICQGSPPANTNNESAGPSQSRPDKEEVPPYFPSWSKCSWHLWKSHKIDCELHSCSSPNCEFKSFFIHKVREHESIHSQLCNYPCLICHKAFKQLKQLRTHEKYHKAKTTKLPPPAESRWYTTQKCEICSRILSDSKCLKKHIAAVHKKLKPHICNICGHQSARKAELLLHMRQHTGEKPYKCQNCPFATGDHNSLRRHALTHFLDGKPYVCPSCPFTCIQSSGFKKHVISKHSEDMDSIFVCPYCPFISVNSSIYENHIRDHDQGRIAVMDMQAPQAEKDSSRVKKKLKKPFVHVDDSSSNSNMSGAGVRNSGYWNVRGEDESSVDMVDTGGITIPAIPTPHDS